MSICLQWVFFHFHSHNTTAECFSKEEGEKTNYKTQKKAPADIVWCWVKPLWMWGVLVKCLCFTSLSQTNVQLHYTHLSCSLVAHELRPLRWSHWGCCHPLCHLTCGEWMNEWMETCKLQIIAYIRSCANTSIYFNYAASLRVTQNYK